MREASLPSPGTGSNGYHLRRVAAKSISDIQKVAGRYAGGNHPLAAGLKAFFVACAAALDAHIEGNAPDNTVAPVLTGTPTVGETLSVTNGTWIGQATITYTRKWLRDGVAIAGATGTTYELVEADAGKAISVEVTATNSLGTNWALSNSTEDVAAE